jgi:hypothetical protein
MENNLDQFSDEELNLVTEQLLNSAKNRFNYKDFRKTLNPFDEDFIDYHILMTIITGKAADESNQTISAKILPNFLLSGFMIEIEDINKMVVEKEKELKLEIFASKIAMDALQSGVHPSLVVQQISKLL